MFITNFFLHKIIFNANENFEFLFKKDYQKQLNSIIFSNFIIQRDQFL